MTVIMDLYRQWQDAVAISNGRMSDDERDAFVNDVLDPIQEKLLAAPICNTADLLARINVELAYVLNEGGGHGELPALIDQQIATAVDVGLQTVTRISPALGRVYRTGVGADPDAQLRELADQFKLDAMTIDPTITGLWAYYDEMIDGRDSAFQGLFLERQGSPLIRRQVRAE